MTPLQRLRALLDASTKGPWHTNDDRPDDPVSRYSISNGDARIIANVVTAEHTHGHAGGLANAAFIAAARNQMDRLLAVAEAIEKQHREYPTQIGLAPFVLRALAALQSTENTDGR